MHVGDMTDPSAPIPRLHKGRRITPLDQRMIYEQARDGVPREELCRAYGLTRHELSRVLRGAIRR